MQNPLHQAPKAHQPLFWRWRSPWRLLWVSLALLSCSPQPPVILEASIQLTQATEGLTPIACSAVAQGSAGPLTATLTVALTEEELSAPSCPVEVLTSARGHNPNEPLTAPEGAIMMGATEAGTEAGAEAGAESGAESGTESGAPPVTPPLTVEGILSPDARCVRAPLERVTQDGDLSYFEGLVTFGPHLPGELLYYRLEVKDSSGRRATYPRETLGVLDVGSVSAPLTLEQITPRSGPSTLQTDVLIKGEGFTRADTLTLTLDGTPLSGVEVISRHLLKARVAQGPAGRAGTLVIQSAGRQAELSEAFLWRAPPLIRAVTPPSGPYDTEVELLVEVDDLVLSGAQTAELQVNGEPVEPLDGPLADHPPLQRLGDPTADPRAGASIAFRVTLPPGPEPLVELVVTGADGQRATATYERHHAPRLDEVSPATGPDAPPQWIALRGAHMRLPGAVWFNDRQALAVELNSEGTLARVLTPLHPGGLTRVRYVNPDGQYGELEGGYRFIGPPLIESADPPEISRCGGGLLTLFGLNLSAGMRVYFNGVEGEVLEVNEEGTEAQVRAPSGEPGPLSLVVLSEDGRRAQRADLLTYGVQPVINSVSPAEAPVWGGTTVQVTGSDLERGGRALIGGVNAERSDLISSGCDSLLEVVVPPNSEGLQDLSYRSQQGQTSTLSEAILYVSPRFEPDEGLKAGYTNLKLTGVDLREGLMVRFNEAPPRAVTRISDEEWLIVTPPSVTFGPSRVSIYNTDGRGLDSTELYRVNSIVSGPPDELNAPGDCNDARAADLNGDGVDDLVLAMGSSSPSGVLNQQDLVFMGSASGAFTRRDDAFPAGLIGNGMNVRVGDLDADGDLDLLMINLFSERNFVLLNQGGGRFLEDPAFSFGQPSYDGGLFDADGDGDLDIFLMQTGDADPVLNASEGPERLFLREGSAWRERSDEVDFDLLDVHDHDMNNADLNGDGLDDVIIVVDNLPQSFPGASNRVLLNRGGGVFERVPSPINNYPGDWLDVAVTDLDGDGNLDVILPQDYIEGISVPNTPAVAVFMGDGQGGLSDESFRIHGMPPLPSFGATPVDIDADGDQDLLVAVYGLSFSDGTVDAFESVLLLNDGAGDLFEANASIQGGFGLTATTHFEPVDLEGDGRLDVLECAAEGASRLWHQRQEP